ncbi:cellulose synthase catalytic subunit [Klebsiella pneumoniae]|uniref:Cellulose synthase catalytic subunit n=1 Tax=Klebsiella pneumoniae TaxID=573 RepID=A0A377VW33_KLEPN|nr:cellulose synthase catalytic subunit [Klebsiella pneumoniae]
MPGGETTSREYRQDSLAAEEVLTLANWWPDPLFRRESGMIRLSTLLLAPPVGERLRARYDDYRQHGASWLSASLGCLWASLVWALMPLETPRWQAILARHETYFPT